MIDLKRLAFENNLNQSELGKILALPQPEVSKMINGRRDIKPEHIDILVERFGEEVVKSYMVDDEIADIFHTPQSRQVTAEIIPAEIVEEIKEEIKEEEAIPIISSEIATRTDLDIREYIEENAGELEHINPSELLQNPDLAERVMGTSMLPTFAPNDIVFVKFLHDKAKIVDGNTYYFDMKTRPTMIRKVKFETNGKLRLIAKNPSYADIITDRSDINNVAKIIGMLRLTFGDQYDEIEELRKKKDRQIDKLVEQNGEALKIIHDLIKK